MLLTKPIQIKYDNIINKNYEQRSIIIKTPELK